MHYKNGTEAREGDTALVKLYNGAVAAGVLHSLQATSASCNGQLAVVCPGGVQQNCVTVGECYSAKEAFDLIEESTKEVVAQEAIDKKV